MKTAKQKEVDRNIKERADLESRLDNYIHEVINFLQDAKDDDFGTLRPANEGIELAHRLSECLMDVARLRKSKISG